MLSATDFLGNGERERIFSIAPWEGNIPLLVIVFRDKYADELPDPGIFL